MALMQNAFSKVPSDAIILTETEALEYQLKLIKGWKHSSDTWVFKHGFSILSGAAALTAIYINNYYRLRFKLHNFGRISSYLPIVAIPSLTCALFHQQFVVRDVLLQKKCATCMEIRAGTYQMLLGVIFPMILAPASAIPFAIRYNTYKVPLITQQPVEVWKLMVRMTKPIMGTVGGLAMFHALLACSLTYWELHSIATINAKLNELELRLQQEQQY